jgi:hypothetical protein
MILNLRFCVFFEEVVSSPASHAHRRDPRSCWSFYASKQHYEQCKAISGIEAYLLHQRPNCLIQFLLCWRITQQQRSHAAAGDFCLAWTTLGGGRLRYTGGAQLAPGFEPSGTWVGISVLFLPENAMALRTLFDKKQPCPACSNGLEVELFGFHWPKMTKRGPCFRFSINVMATKGGIIAPR